MGLTVFYLVKSTFQKICAMPFDNLISISFTPQEVTQLNDAFTVIENILNDKVQNLTPKERKKYSKIADKTENFVVKSVDYIKLKPDLVPFFVDVAEMNKDIEARKVFDPMMKRLKRLYEECDDTNKIIGYDVYNCVIAFYRNIRMLSKQNIPGINTIYDDLKKHFKSE